MILFDAAVLPRLKGARRLVPDRRIVGYWSQRYPVVFGLVLFGLSSTLERDYMALTLLPRPVFKSRSFWRDTAVDHPAHDRVLRAPGLAAPDDRLPVAGFEAERRMLIIMRRAGHDPAIAFSLLAAVAAQMRQLRDEVSV